MEYSWDKFEPYIEGYNYEDATLTIKKKFESGVTSDLYIEVNQTSIESPLYLFVELATYTKRKHRERPDFFYSINGKDGLRPAIWVTQHLLNFPAFLLWNYKDRDKVVYQIEWADSRRRDVYYKWLSRYGFYYDVTMHGTKCLSKEYNRSNFN